VVFVCRKRPEFAGFVLDGECADCAVPVAIVLMHLEWLQILCKVGHRSSWTYCCKLLVVFGRLPPSWPALQVDGQSALDKLALSDGSNLPATRPCLDTLGSRSRNYAVSDRTADSQPRQNTVISSCLLLSPNHPAIPLPAIMSHILTRLDIQSAKCYMYPYATAHSLLTFQYPTAISAISNHSKP
jgi:hypothetical protein